MCSRKQASPKPRRNNRGNKCTWEMNLMAWLLALIQSLSSQLELSLGIDMCRVSAMQDGVFAITASLYVKPSNIAPLTSEKSFKDSLSGSVRPSLPLLTSPLTQKGTRQHICWHVHVRHTDTHTHTQIHTDMRLDWLREIPALCFSLNRHYLPQRKSLWTGCQLSAAEQLKSSALMEEHGSYTSHLT